MVEGRVRLSSEEVARFHEDGYVVPRTRLPDEVLAEMRQAYDRLLADNDGIASDIMLGPHLEKPGAQGVKGSRQWLDFAARPEILDMAEQLIGPDIILWGTTIFGKPAGGGKETPWHQDGDYYPIRPLETLTVWIAIDDATPENGCMRFIPGSHKAREIFGHHWQENDGLTINLVCDEEHFDESTARDLVLRAGEMSFHDVYMIHQSGPNNSDRRRAAFVVRLMPGRCFYDHKLGEKMAEQHPAQDYGRRPLFLLRGRDACGRNDFTTGH
jgi:ectoine hydroxylase-related dioxygenase (phytanoyl-CoA dioxygenase family)